MNLRQAAQQALESMDDHMYRADTHEFYEAKEALRQALAAPEPEPEPDYWQEEARRYAGNADYWRKRYKALAEPVQEPVAWMQEMPISGNEERSVRMTTVKMVADDWENPIPLFTQPAQALAEPEQEPVAQAFADDLARSRAKHPGNARMFDALLGEVHELKRAYLGDGDIRSEALDVAVVAYRIAAEFDGGGNAKLDNVPDWMAWGEQQHE